MAPAGTSLGSTLRAARSSRSVSQSALARRTGIPQSAISRIEAGTETPSLERFARLLAGLGLAPNVELGPLAQFRGDRRHMEAIRSMAPGERLVQAAAWERLAGELRGQAATGR